MVTKTGFGKRADGSPVDCWILKNGSGMEVRVLTHGAIIQRILVPDREGVLRDVALYCEDMPGYEADTAFLGACIAPHGNRIAGASFEYGGQTFILEKNNGENNLHSGTGNAGKMLWEAEALESGDGVVLRIGLADGAGGFPGNRKVEVTYRLTEDNALEISYRGETDRDTVFNMTNHSYFNFGSFEDHVLFTELMIDADAVTEVGPGLIPTGRLLPVEGTPFDFRRPKRIGRDAFDPDCEQLELGGGYDNNFALNGTGYRKVVEAWLPETGVCMEVLTDQPGIQLYAGNFVKAPYGKNRGFALETQHYPDSVHHENFPPVITKAGEVYETKTAYRFSVR